MNHLKHIRGISVRASPNTALPLHHGQHTNVYFENRQLKSQLLRSNPLSVAKKGHDVDVRYSGQFRQDSLRFLSKESKTISKQRSKTKSSVTSLKRKSSMHKKLPSENIARRVCHYSTCQNVKFNSNGINKQLLPHDETINGAKNINRHSSFIASVEKHPRTYAEMIADYSESLYKESTAAARNDSSHFNNAIRKSPFSTFSVSSSANAIANVAECSELSTERQKNAFLLPVKSFDLCNRYNSINTTECYDFHHHGACSVEAMNKNTNQSCVIAKNDLKSDDQSYAKLVADCSKSMHNVPNTSVLNDGLLKKNVLARNSLESVTTPREDNNIQNKLRKITPSTVSTMPFEKNTKEHVIDLKEDDWLREMESVMSDLKSVTKRKLAKVVPQMKESDILPVEVSGNLLDRSQGLTELIKSNEQKGKDTAVRKLSYQSNKFDRKRKKDFELQKHNYSLSSDKASNLPQYFGNATESSAIRKNSTHVLTSDNTSVLKQPQVKLRMVPSEKESVVSINVDQASTGSNPVNSSKHLSVVVQSDQKEDLPTLRRTAKSVLQRSDFGPMHISISEDSAPVKQIEFSINGKPVSELKSITARTERLDVVSSMDKIEIRIPFAKDDSNTLDKTREGDLSKGINSNTGQILNVQISANFQNESTKGSSVEIPAKTTRYQYNKDTMSKSSSSTSKPPYLSNNFTKAYEETLNSNNKQCKFSKRMNIKYNDEKNINKHKISGDFEIQRKATGKTMTDISLIKEVNNAEVGRLNTRKANTTRFPENKYNKNESSDNRVPSKIIPWWSSSDSFNKIRKKEDDHRPRVPPSTRNDHRAVSDLNNNFITETLLSKPKETSNSKILTKKTQSNTATVTTSDSSNVISYSNFIKPYEESKPTLHYACSFRLKPHEENLGIIPEIRNDLKVEDNQVLTANKNINKISGVKQTKSITLFKSDTMNIKGKHDVKEETSKLQRKIKIPSSAQNLSPNKNQEKKNNYSLKQTRSIEDVPKNIQSKIKDILNTIKPTEEKENILVDYSLKREMLSKKPTVTLNSGVQNPSLVITTKDFISNSPTAEIVSKKIDKTMLTKQVESTKEKLKTKMNILLKEKELKNDATIDIKALNKNNSKNINEIHKNDFKTLKKQEQLADDSIGFQDKSKQKSLKLLLEADKNGPSSSLNMRISSGTVQRSEKLEISRKVLLEESKQNRPKSLTSIKNTPETTQESNKLKDSIASKLANPLKESPNTMINKSPLQTVKQIQSKSLKNTNKIANTNTLSSSQTISNLTSKIKDRAGPKNLINKDTGEISITQSAKTKKNDMRARIVTQNPKNKDSLSKDCEDNVNKSGFRKGNLLGSADPSRKPNDLVGFKSAGSKTKSRVMSNNNCAYGRKLFVESFYSNFNRKNDIMLNSQSAIFKVRQNLSDVDMLKHPVSTAIGCDGSWINIDRPEKSILYSAWLQRSENDIRKNGKLF